MRILLMLASLLMLAGCLPPTQDQLRMQMDLAEMKRRLAQLEINNVETAQTEAAGGDSLQRQVAELNAGLDNLRVEFQSVNGRIDDLAQENRSARDEMQLVKEDMGLQLTSLENRVSELEKQLQNNGVNAPLAPEAPTPGQDQVQTPATPAQVAPEQLYEQALGFIRSDKRFKDGRTLLEEFVSKYPQHELYVNALYWIGESYYGDKEYEMAILQFQDVISKYGKHPKAPAAMLKQALAFNALGDSQNARTTMKKLVEEYPGTSQADSAKSYLEKM